MSLYRLARNNPKPCGVYPPMGTILRWMRVTRIVAILLVSLAMIAAVSIPIQQGILRWRAERLLSDIHALQLGKSTWIDAQKIMTRWGAWGQYKGICTQERCSYQIEMEDFFGQIPTFNRKTGHVWDAAQGWPWLLRTYEFFGGRSAIVIARFEVIRDVVWAKDFVFGLDVDEKNAEERWDYLLFGSANTEWRTERFGQHAEPGHPEYVVGRPGGCEGCEVVYARYTPYASPKDVDRLLDFDLECLTRRNPCRHAIDIMPATQRQLITERTVREKEIDAGRYPWSECLSPPEFLGRDQANVVLAQVESAHLDDRNDGTLDVDFRLLDRMKRATFWNQDAVRTVILPARATEDPSRKMSVLVPGQKFILAFRSLYPVESTKSIDVDACNPISLNDQNLNAILRGIRRDVFPETRDFWP